MLDLINTLTETGKISVYDHKYMVHVVINVLREVHSFLLTLIYLNF